MKFASIIAMAAFLGATEAIKLRDDSDPEGRNVD